MRKKEKYVTNNSPSVHERDVLFGFEYKMRPHVSS